ncbi:MAG: non-homologous end-joining DNA ligase [Acidimicrobiales bacterium]
MKAVADNLPLGAEWAYEIKWDGMRAIVSTDPSGVVAWSSRLNDITHRFPELGELRHGLGGVDAVLDGELVALAADGLPSFERLQRRIHLDRASDIERQTTENPVGYVVVDLLRLDGNETVNLAYDERRRILEALVDSGPTWQLAASHSGDGQELLAAVEAQGLEGVVSKLRTSLYKPGQRSRDWVKTKVDRRQELVVGGLMSGEGSRAPGIGALLVGFHDQTGLRYAGRVGSGFGQAEARRISDLAGPLATEASPFVDSVEIPNGRTVVFVEPSLVVEVRFTEWTRDLNLRHPVYIGLRIDADPLAVIREPDHAARRQS